MAGIAARRLVPAARVGGWRSVASACRCEAAPSTAPAALVGAPQGVAAKVQRVIGGGVAGELRGWAGVLPGGARRLAHGGAGAAAEADDGVPENLDAFQATGRTTAEERHGEILEHLRGVYGREPTWHELNLYADATSDTLPKTAEHGFLYDITEEDLDAVGAPELVRQALGTHLGAVDDHRRFRISEAIQKFRQSPFDTGSSRVAAAVLTERINFLAEHIERHHKDQHAKRALQMVIHRRRKLLRYMMRRDYNNYRIVVRELKLRPLPVHYSKFPPSNRVRVPHAEVHKKHASKKRKRKGRGHLGH